MIHIWEPRYHDKTLLIKVEKLKKDSDNQVMIDDGYYKGEYILPKEAYDELMEAKSLEHRNFQGGEIDLLIVPLDKLKKKEK